MVWENIAADLAKNSFIRFGWLSDGVFDRIEQGRMTIRFPASSKESALVFMEEGIKTIEAQILRQMDQPLRVAMEFDDTLEAKQPEPVVEHQVQEEALPSPPVIKDPKPPADPMEEFLNDPLIEKALEKFEGTLQTPRP